MPLFTAGRSVRLQADRGAEQVPSLHRIGRRHTRRAENRRRDIRQAHRLVAHRRGHAGRRDDERHAQRRVVGEHAVRPFAVIAEPLAVIAGDDTIVRSSSPDARSHSSSRDSCASAYATLAVVRRRGALPILGRRRVRRVRIVEVDPQEEGGWGWGGWAAGGSVAGRAVKPRERAVDDR